MLRKLIGLTNIFESNLLGKLEFNGNSNKVFIYIVNLNNCKLLIPQFWEYLSAEERSQANKYYTSNLRDLYIISHGILRCILSYYTKPLPQEIEFIHNKYGKPFLKEHLKRKQPLYTVMIKFDIINVREIRCLTKPSAKCLKQELCAHTKKHLPFTI